MTHKFDTEIAKEVGLLGAVLYDNIEWWCMKNKSSNINKHDGKYWTYNSNRGWAELFDYATESQIKLALKKLENAELIVSGTFNKLPYDRTKWYRPKSLTHQTEKSNETDRKVQPIPSNKPSNKPSNNYLLFIEELKEQASIPSKVTITKKGKEFFSQIENVDKLKIDYVAYQADKKEFAKRITDYMEDYQTAEQPEQHYSERLGYIV